jgi:hypothetical protein
VPEGECQQVILGGKVRLEGPVREAGLKGDFPHGGTFNAEPGDDPPGRVDEFKPPLVVVDNLWHRAAPQTIFRWTLVAHLTIPYSLQL